MKVIGLTGGTGSGKSVVSRRLAAEGLVIIDADRISHEIIEQGKPAYREILGYFGSGILDENGDIVRRQLAFNHLRLSVRKGVYFQSGRQK